MQRSLYKWSYRILLRRSWHSWHLAQKMLIHRSCTSGPTHPAGEILKPLHKRSSYRDLAPSGPTGPRCRRPDREILHKRSAYRDLAQVVIQDPDAKVLTQKSRHRDTHKRSAYRDAAQVALQNPAEEMSASTHSDSSADGTAAKCGEKVWSLRKYGAGIQIQNLHCVRRTEADSTQTTLKLKTGRLAKVTPISHRMGQWVPHIRCITIKGPFTEQTENAR